MTRLLTALLSLTAITASAQNTELFGTGKPVKYHEETLDRRFMKSGFAKMLASGTDNPACVQLLGGMLTVLAEAAPMMHKRDENFFIDPVLQDALNTQLSTPAFPAMQYFVAMVRRVMLLGRMPDEWLETAKNLNSTVKVIDLAKLKQINEGVALADSAYFSIPVLRQAFVQDVLAANSAVTTDVVATFRDTYLDRDIAWGGATLLDAGLNKPKGKNAKRKTSLAEDTELVAILEWLPPDPRKQQVDLLNTKPVKVDPVRIIVKLSPKQFLDLEKVARGQRMLVKGRFWEMTASMHELEVREGRLFYDRDFSNGVLLGRPEDVAQCPIAVNELTGLAPQQPGGFAH